MYVHVWLSSLKLPWLLQIVIGVLGAFLGISSHMTHFGAPPPSCLGCWQLLQTMTGNSHTNPSFCLGLWHLLQKLTGMARLLMPADQRWAKWRLSSFDLYPGGGGGGHGMQGQICDILTQASYVSLPAPSGHTDSHTLDAYIWGGGGLWYEIDVEHSTYLQVSMPTSAADDLPCFRSG